MCILLPNWHFLHLKYLFYPNTIKGYQDKVSELFIEDELADGRQISIKSYQLPIINESLLSQPFDKGIYLAEMFEETKEKLIGKIKEILL